MPLESYILGDVIGKGSYGEVTLARHKRDKKQYVIKKIDFHNASSKERSYAQQEVEILSKLRHPNIVSYKESFQTEDGGLSIVMGYCELGDLYCHLKKQLKRGEFLSETKVVEWFVQISMALQYMHDRHILHRDLKTQNIFLTKSKIIKLGDLGIARVLESKCDMATTMIGTPYYMSPELFSNKPYNHKSDVWALGCCLYEMTTLKHAFNARDMNSLVYKILKGKTPDMPSNYSHDLHDIIKSMLNYDPALRPSASRLLRLPYIKKQIALFLEGTKNRRHHREQKKPAKENDISMDSGFSEASHEAAHEDAQGIATASKIELHVADEHRQDAIEITEKKVGSSGNKMKVKNSNNHVDVSNREIRNNPPKESNERFVKNNIINSVEVSSDSSISGNIDEGNNKKEHPKPTNVRKILSDRIQAKARLKRRELEEKRTSIEIKILPTDINSSNGHQHESVPIKKKDKLLSSQDEKMPNRQLPPLSSDVLPKFRCHSNTDKESKTKQETTEEGKPKTYTPNIAARKKRRLRQQQSDSYIHIPVISQDPNRERLGNSSPCVSEQSTSSRSKEEIIKEHLSKASSNSFDKDVADGPPGRKVATSPEENVSDGEEAMSAADRSEKGAYDVSSLIDNLQATLTMGEKSKDHSSPDGSEDFEVDKSITLSPSATGRLKHRIKILKKECVDGVGEELLQQAYEIINSHSENDVEKSLIKLLGRNKFDEFGGQIWQLKFCEEF